MKALAHFVTVSIALIVGSPAYAEPANIGEPFGKEIVAPAARNKEIKDAVQENGPGGVADVVHENLADDGDDGETGNIRGHGPTDAPGHNK